jgi:hypothetical protein
VAIPRRQRRETEFRQANGRAKEKQRNQRTDLEETGATSTLDIHSFPKTKSFFASKRLYRREEFSLEIASELGAIHHHAAAASFAPA